MFHKRLMKEFASLKRRMIEMVAAQWLMLIANIILMYVTAVFINEVAAGTDVKHRGGALVLTLILVILVRALATAYKEQVSLASSGEVKTRLRSLTYDRLMELGSNYCDVTPTAEAVQISTEGVEQLEIYFGKYIPQFFYAMLAPLTLFIVTGIMSMKVALVLLICVPLIPMSIVAVQKFAKKMLARYWGTYTELGDGFLESLQALTTLKIYQADDRYAKKMDEEAEKFRKVTMRVLIMQLNSISVMDIVAYGGAAVGIILSILEYQNAHITLTQCFFLIMISAEFFLPMRTLGSFFHIAMNGNAAADKIFKLLDAQQASDGTVCEVESSEITVEHVSFAYEADVPVLSEVSLTISAGMTAFVGESGCGKTTMTGLLMKRLVPTEGSIRIGEVPLEALSQEALHRKITRIGHDSYLFAGTIRDNLLMGCADATDQELLAALARVKLLDFVMEQEAGLELVLQERAANLSGGQKQRLALARALLRDSDIYIFDEATSNVDSDSEDDIMRVVAELAREKTVLVISHRLANIVSADRIYVMQSGKIVETGSHKELRGQNGYYELLYSSQKQLEEFNEEVSYAAE